MTQKASTRAGFSEKIFAGKSRWIIVLVAVLIGLRLLLPEIIKWQANKKLSQLEDYTGHIDGVHLALWRAGFNLNDIELKRRVGDGGLTIKRFGFHISWTQLIRGAVVADMEVLSPRLRLLASPPSAPAPKEAPKKSPEEAKAELKKVEKSLPEALSQLIPFQIREFRLHDGTIRLQENQQNLNALQEKDKKTPEDSHEGSAREKPLEARVTHLEIEAHNLTNAAKLSGTTYATGQVKAQIMDSGKLTIDLKFNPVASKPTFNINIAATQVNLAELNPLFRSQWGVDVTTGTFEMFVEAAAGDGNFKGYIKPFIHNLEMHDARQDAHKSLGARIKEAVVDVAAAILKNSDSKNVAARVSFEGQFEGPSVGIWDSVVTILRNAFVKALSPRLDKSINVSKGGHLDGFYS